MACEVRSSPAPCHGLAAGFLALVLLSLGVASAQPRDSVAVQVRDWSHSAPSDAPPADDIRPSVPAPSASDTLPSVPVPLARDSLPPVPVPARDTLASSRAVAAPSGDTLRFAPAEAAPVPGSAAVDASLWSGRDAPLVLPAVAPQLDAAHVLASVPGSFLYDLGAPGWPHGWSPDGIDPAAVGVEALQLSWNDPVSGRPRLDLLPIAFLEPLVVESGDFGRPAGISARLRTYHAPRPSTELRYWKGAESLQSIAATHAQRRRMRLFGRDGDLNVLAGYGGRASEGEYPGSRLRRERKVLSRVRFEGPTWHWQVFDLHTRHQVGAHGGVLERPGQGFESVYNRFGARVRNERAIRRTVRNDLVAEFGIPATVMGARPVVRGFWTAQTFRYRDPADTLEVDTDRLGGQLGYSLRLGRFDPALTFTALTERSEMNWSAETARHVELHLAVRDSARFGPLRVAAAVGIHRAPDSSPSASLSARYGSKSASLFGHVAYGTSPPALIHEFGLGARVVPAASRPNPRTALARAGARVRLGALSLGITGFANAAKDHVVLVPANGDTAIVALSNETVGRAGLTGELGVRATTKSGFYLTIESTLVKALGSESPVADRLADALPSAFGCARGGLRYTLFRGDLDLHAFFQVRAWTGFRSRTLHPSTGLLILPETGGPVLGPSSTVSIYIEGGVREATIFLVWENVTSGTAFMDGTMLVPVYPLSEKAFRFGVFWPIWD